MFGTQGLIGLSVGPSPVLRKAGDVRALLENIKLGKPKLVKKPGDSSWVTPNDLSFIPQWKSFFNT